MAQTVNYLTVYFCIKPGTPQLKCIEIKTTSEIKQVTRYINCIYQLIGLGLGYKLKYMEIYVNNE